MKHFCFWGLIIFILISALPVHAQTKFGFRAGLNLANLGNGRSRNASYIKNVTSFKVGSYADVNLGSGFSLQPGLEFTGKGGEDVYELGVENYRITLQLFYVSIPVNILYNIPLSFGKVYFGGGPYAGLGVAGKYKNRGLQFFGVRDLTDVTIDRDIRYGSTANADVKRTDFGVNGLAGLQLNGGFNVGLNYNLGLSNLTQNSRATAKNHVLGFTVGYFF